MISIVISIQSLWACKILNGDKKIEVRKGLALYNALKKAEERGEEVELLMYVTKDPRNQLVEVHGNPDGKTDFICLDARKLSKEVSTLNGKVVAKLKGYADRIYDVDDMGILYEGDGMSCETILTESRLTFKQLDDYLLGGKGTALHIEDLEIFDNPKTLADYGLKRAPESWCYAKKGGANEES